MTWGERDTIIFKVNVNGIQVETPSAMLSHVTTFRAKWTYDTNTPNKLKIEMEENHVGIGQRHS